MKDLLPFLIFLSSVACIGQTTPIPESNWEKARQYLAAQKDLSAIYMLGSGEEIKINLGVGYADRGNKVPYTDRTLFTVGSITKSFTATAILLLMDRGKLSLQEPMTVHFENVPEDKKGITIHHLLTHAAGFPGAIGDDYEAITAQEFQKLAWETPLLFSPGTGYEYSNVGYSLLGMIIEKVSQQTYSDYLQENIFQPANMQTAGYDNSEADYRLLAHGYTSDGDDWGTSHDKNWGDHEPYWHLKANGGILMSALDMSRWYQALRTHKVLRPEMLKLQTTPYSDEGHGSYYGYGYAVDSLGECVQHNGSNGIFKADFRWFPKADFFLFSATNDANVRLFRLNEEIIRILITGEIPVEKNWVEIPVEKFPADENQYTAHAFIELIRGYSENKAVHFIPEYCTTQMIERNGQKRLSELFQMLHSDIDVQSSYKIYASGDNVMVAFEKRDEPVKVKISLGMSDHKINTLGAEIGN